MYFTIADIPYGCPTIWKSRLSNLQLVQHPPHLKFKYFLEFDHQFRSGLEIPVTLTDGTFGF